MLYTGYHSRKYEGCKRFSISVGNPKNAKIDEWVLPLAPTWKMLKMGEEEYKKNYDEILLNADINGVMEDIIKKSKQEDIVLLCWEKDINQCHRKYVADYIKKRYDIEVPEYGKEVKKKLEQYDLF